MLNLNLISATLAKMANKNANQSTENNEVEKPFGQKICAPKKTAKLTITPTTAAVMAVKGAEKFTFFWLDSINGAPTKIKINEGKKVKNVTAQAANIADISILGLSRFAGLQSDWREKRGWMPIS